MPDNQCRALRDVEQHLRSLASSLRDAVPATDGGAAERAAFCELAAEQVHAAADTIDRLSDRLDTDGVAYQLTSERVRHAEAHERMLRSELGEAEDRAKRVAITRHELRDALVELQSAAWARNWKRLKKARTTMIGLVGFDVPGPIVKGPSPELERGGRAAD